VASCCGGLSHRFAFGALILLGGLNGIAAKQILRELG
jgi:hypothetical protein